MADNSTYDPGAGGDTYRSKDRTTAKTEIVGLDIGIGGGSEVLMTSAALADATSNPTTAPWAGMLMCFNGTTWDRVRGDTTNGVDVDVTRIPGTAANGGSLPGSQHIVGGYDGTNTRVLKTDSSGVLAVQDNGATLSVDDGAGSLTVDGTVGVSGTVTVDSELTTADLDTGAGTDTRAVVGLVIAKSGGAANVSNSDPIPISDAGGNLSIDDGGNSITVDGTVTANAGTGPFPVSDNAGSLTVDATAGTFGVNCAQVSGTAVSVNSGAKDAGTQRVILASDQTVVPISDNSGSLTVDNAGTFAVQDSEKIADDAAFTVATTKVMPVGFLADQTSTDSVNEGDVGAARITLDRKQIVTIAPSADTEGWSVFNATSGDGSTALTNSAQAIKGSAGRLSGWFIYNPNATAAYVPIYNVAAASVTVGTTNPLMVLCIPATSAANLTQAEIGFSTAISAAAATTAGGNGALTTALEANFFYV